MYIIIYNNNTGVLQFIVRPYTMKHNGLFSFQLVTGVSM